MSKNINIMEFVPQGVSSLVGRQNGKDCKARMYKKGVDFEKLEKDGPIHIIIPDMIVSMNKSFFLGVWADRVRALNEDKFCELYIFDASEHIRNKVKKHIQAALLTATQEEILNATAKR